MSDNSKPAEGEQPENPEQHGLFWPRVADDDDAPSTSAGMVLLEEAPPQRQSSGEGLLNAMKAVETGRKFSKLAGPQQPMPPLADAPAAPPDHKFLTHFDGPPFDFQQLSQLSDAHVFAEANKGDDQQKDKYPLSDAMVQLHPGPTVAPTTADVGATDNKTIFQMMNDDEALSVMEIVPNDLMSEGAMRLVCEFIERLAPAQRLAACKALVEEAIAAVKSALPHEKPRRCHTTSNVEGDEELEWRVSASVTDSVKRILPSVDGLDRFIRRRVTRFFNAFWKPRELDLTQDPAGIRAEFITIIDEMIEDEASRAELEFRAEQADKPPDARMHSLADEHLMPTTRDTTLDVFGATAVKTAAKEEEPDSEDDSEDDSEGDQHLQMSQRSAKLLREVDSILVRRYEDEADVNFQVLNLTVELIRQKYRRDNISSPS